MCKETPGCLQVTRPISNGWADNQSVLSVSVKTRTSERDGKTDKLVRPNLKHSATALIPDAGALSPVSAGG